MNIEMTIAKHDNLITDIRAEVRSNPLGFTVVLGEKQQHYITTFNGMVNAVRSPLDASVYDQSTALNTSQRHKLSQVISYRDALLAAEKRAVDARNEWVTIRDSML